MKKYSRSLFIFRRDLRCHDNTALNTALGMSDSVIACFIFDPRQIEAHPYQSRFGLQFMLQSIEDLTQQLEEAGGCLNIYHGLPPEVVSQLQTTHGIEAVFVNRDYTPFSRQRDDELYQLCQQRQLDFWQMPDALLTEPEQLLKADGTPYKVFTAFHNKARTWPVNAPAPLQAGQFAQAFEKNLAYDPKTLQDKTLIKTMAYRGGSLEAEKRLQALSELGQYELQRDFPAKNATSQLSAHLKFGTCSVRAVHQAVRMDLGNEHPLLRQLYWRDFFTHIGYHFPHVFGQAFVEKYRSLRFDNDPELFQRWADGQTGFPIVDAGMRQLNATGDMHNRVRMITASFLIKDLHIHWRWGERYFAQRLIDYDPCLNNGNWQWAASTGCDAQPYFRIFNPWRQQKKFDADCRYIYRWIPELKKFPPAIIHKWDLKYAACDYPKPMLNHALESEKAKQMFK